MPTTLAKTSKTKSTVKLLRLILAFQELGQFTQNQSQVQMVRIHVCRIQACMMKYEYNRPQQTLITDFTKYCLQEENHCVPIKTWQIIEVASFPG